MIARRHELLVPVCLAAAAFGVRLFWSMPMEGEPSDPDGYIQMARSLGWGQRAWRWTPEAITYAEFVKAPLYQTTLSLITSWSLPLLPWGLTLHALLNACTVIALYVIGSSLHSRRAGLIAAAVYAVWIPNILVTKTFWQEHLSVPSLYVGIALLARAIALEHRPLRWAVAGGILGVSALTRSSVLYFVPVACLLLLARRAPGARWGVAALIAGFTIVTVPYITYVSGLKDRLVLVEDIGAFALKRSATPGAADPRIRLQHFMADPEAAPGGGETLRFLAADARTDPLAFVIGKAEFARMLYKPSGASFLLNSVSPDRAAAARLKAGVHAGLDAPFLLAVILAPMGVLVSRRREIAWLLALWIAQLSVMLVLANWAGTRFRAPIEPALVVLSAAVLAGGWRRPGSTGILLAITASAGMALLAGSSIRQTVDARPAYGVTVVAEREWAFSGEAGLTIPAARELRLILNHDGPAGGRDATVIVSLDRRPIDRFQLAAGAGRSARYPLLTPGGGYVEISARLPDGAPAPMTLRLP